MLREWVYVKKFVRNRGEQLGFHINHPDSAVTPLRFGLSSRQHKETVLLKAYELRRVMSRPSEDTPQLPRFIQALWPPGLHYYWIINELYEHLVSLSTDGMPNSIPSIIPSMASLTVPRYIADVPRDGCTHNVCSLTGCSFAFTRRGCCPEKTMATERRRLMVLLGERTRELYM
ncbi:hypothetical protein EYF80_036154 [Liparis tanakae]|uniref:Uncharacterized protein n=1 Tax=Liparis tanakae TaxID=230148 RepID=A0A4Z2GJK3_9TELE|nr:hypothetical protein EYF80_036154 [Liparis tanakae]